MDEDIDDHPGIIVPSEYFERDRKYSNNNSHNFDFGYEYSQKLLEKYKSKTKFTRDAKLELSQLFLNWSILLRRKFNIAVVGQESSNKLLKHARRHMEDFFDLRYQFHGFDQCNLTLFRERVLKTDNEDAFLKDLRANSSKVVIYISSYVSLYRKNPDTIDYMWKLYERQPDSFGFILSLDHVNSGKLLKRAAHKIVYCDSHFNESFLKERIENNHTDMPDNLGQTIELKSIQDIYQALQADCQKILQYILRYFIDNPKDDVVLEFNKLMEYSQSKFICRRAAAVRSYLGELSDHKIIETVKPDFRTFRSQVNIDVSKNFLLSLDNTNLE